MSDTVAMLGAPDPEMQAIEALFRAAGVPVVYAATADEVEWHHHRVHPGNVYSATSVIHSVISPERTLAVASACYPRRASPVSMRAQPLGSCERDDDHVIAVECDGPILWLCRFCGDMPDPAHVGLGIADDGQLGGMGVCGDAHRWPTVERIDHHRPGDPGYGRPPNEFLPASSLGQVISWLAREGLLPKSWEKCTMDDELPRGAYQYWGGHPDQSYLPHWAVVAVAYGETGDVSYGGDAGYGVHVPHELVLTAAADHCLGAAYRGECPGVDPEELMTWRAESRAAFQARPVADVLVDVRRAKDALRAAPTIVLARLPGYAITCTDMRLHPIPELPEAATRLGISYISGPLIGPDGREKYTCSGSEHVVRAWMDVWAPGEGLVDIYGDPARGFAGGYVRGGRGNHE